MISLTDIELRIEIRFGLEVYRALYRGTYVVEALSEMGAITQALQLLNSAVTRKKQREQVKSEIILANVIRRKEVLKRYNKTQLNQLKGV